ncbi:MAG: PAS domain-containing sensor histidine kinase [Bacteroidota bacterium]
MSILKKIVKAGTEHFSDPVEARRGVFFNYLLLICISGGLFLAIADIYFGLIGQAVVCGGGALTYSFSLFLNSKGYFRLSKYIFLVTSLTFLSTGTWLNMQAGLFIETENLLLALMACTMFMLDNKEKHFAFWAVFLVFISFKHYGISHIAVFDSFEYYLGLTHSILVCLVLYLLLVTLRYILMKALDSNYQHEKRLYSLLDNVPIFMALVDKNGKYVLANKNYADNFQTERSAIIGKNRLDILPEKLIESQRAAFAKAQKGEATSFLHETPLVDGQHMIAKGKYEPILDDTGQVEAITICVDDVSALIKAQQDLKKANETKDKLFSIMAHDIRSPLSMFETFVNMSKDAEMSKEEFFEYQKLLEERLSSLTHTVDELLGWSRMQLGGINAYPTQVNVCDVVKENVGLFDSLIKKKKIDFKMDASCDISAWIDENHFKVAIRNLIHNAIKFTNGGGSVEVHTNQNERQTIVKVVDTGIGMDSKTVDSIIKKEIQDSQAGTEKEMGTGLGLSLTMGLLERNHCEILVDSRPNEGSTFEIRIPKQPAGTV